MNLRAVLSSFGRFLLLFSVHFPNWLSNLAPQSAKKSRICRGIVRDDYPEKREGIGMIYEVALEYPSELHDLHNDYPCTAQKLKVTDEMLPLIVRISKINSELVMEMFIS